MAAPRVYCALATYTSTPSTWQTGPKYRFSYLLYVWPDRESNIAYQLWCHVLNQLFHLAGILASKKSFPKETCALQSSFFVCFLFSHFLFFTIAFQFYFVVLRDFCGGRASMKTAAVASCPCITDRVFCTWSGSKMQKYTELYKQTCVPYRMQNTGFIFQKIFEKYYMQEYLHTCNNFVC